MIVNFLTICECDAHGCQPTGYISSCLYMIQAISARQALLTHSWMPISNGSVFVFNVQIEVHDFWRHCFWIILEYFVSVSLRKQDAITGQLQLRVLWLAMLICCKPNLDKLAHCWRTFPNWWFLFCRLLKVWKPDLFGILKGCFFVFFNCVGIYEWQ